MSYTLLPFRFDRFSDGEVFISNEVGEFMFASRSDLERLVTYRLDPGSQTFLSIKAKQILTDTEVVLRIRSFDP